MIQSETQSPGRNIWLNFRSLGILSLWTEPFRQHLLQGLLLATKTHKILCDISLKFARTTKGQLETTLLESEQIQCLHWLSGRQNNTLQNNSKMSSHCHCQEKPVSSIAGTNLGQSAPVIGSAGRCLSC